MDNGASSYRRFRDEGDASGLAEIVKDYKDGLILYLTSLVGDRTIPSGEKHSGGYRYFQYSFALSMPQVSTFAAVVPTARIPAESCGSAG